MDVDLAARWACRGDTWHAWLDAVPELHGEGLLDLDLSQCTHLDAVALTGILSLVEAANSEGRPVRLRRPRATEPLIDLTTGGALTLLEALDVAHDLPRADYSYDPGVLHVWAFGDEDDLASCGQVVHDALEPYDEGLAFATYVAVMECGQNALQHSGCRVGFVAVRCDADAQLVQFALGDSGCGVRGALGDESARGDGAALRSVLSLSEGPGHRPWGVSLRDVYRTVRQHDGELELLSGRAYLRAGAAGTAQLVESARRSAGTLVQGSLTAVPMQQRDLAG